MFKKIKYLLDNYDAIKEIVEEHKAADKKPEKKKHKRVSIAGVPEEQKKYIEKNFKINE